MELNTVLKLRRSTRAYTDQQISAEQVAALLESAMAAPVGMARYDRVHLSVVQDRAVLDELNSMFQAAVNKPEAVPTYNAPTVIFISCDKEYDDLGMGANASCLMENMMLTATDLGLGNVYLFGMIQVLKDNPRVPELLQVPEGYRTVCGIAVGYATTPLTEREIPADRITVNYV